MSNFLMGKLLIIKKDNNMSLILTIFYKLPKKTYILKN